jgi:plastocyanin
MEHLILCDMKLCSYLSHNVCGIAAAVALGGVSSQAQLAPKVTITSPMTRVVLLEPAVLTASANATDRDGLVKRVEFYLSGVMVGLADKAPYTLALKPVPAGKYLLTARAIDNSGLSSTSAPVKVVVRHVVEYGNNYFNPADLHIRPGESVLFVNRQGTHTVTGTGAEAFCGSAAVNSCIETFPNTGTFPYRCLFHSSPTAGMIGVVNVVNLADAPPSVELASPANGARFIVGSPISVAASAFDAEGSITNVQFLDGKRVLGKDRTAPYGFTVSNLALGKHTLSARAFDNRGQCRLSTPVVVTVANH